MKTWNMLIGFLGIAANCFSQGIVNFNNNVFTVPNATNGVADHLVYSNYTGLDGTKLTGTQYSAELYAGADASSLQPLTASISKFRVSTTSSPGTWSGKSSLQLGMGGVGVPLTLDIRVWDTTLAASYEEAAASNGTKGPFGESGPFTYTQIVSSGNPASDTFMVTMPAFVVALIPEPSAVALSILGAIGLLVLRRQQPNKKPEIGGSAHLKISRVRIACRTRDLV